MIIYKYLVYEKYIVKYTIRLLKKELYSWFTKLLIIAAYFFLRKFHKKIFGSN